MLILIIADVTVNELCVFYLLRQEIGTLVISLTVSSSLLGRSKSDKVVFKVGSSLLRVTRIVKDCPSIVYSEEKENVIW